MRKIKFIKIFLTVVAFSFLSSCNGENEPVDPAIILNPQASDLPIVFKVGVNGQTYTASQVSAVFVGGNIIMSAFRGTEQESFQIDIKGTSVDTYLTNQSIIGYRSGIAQPLFSSVNPADALTYTGRIIISSINTVNKRISGSFECTGYNNNGNLTLTKEFTNGVFTNIPYTIN